MKLCFTCVVFAIGCGGGGDGGNGGDTILLGGDINYWVGNNSYVPGWGAAIPSSDDSGAFEVVIGNKAFGCSLESAARLPQGEFVVFDPTSLSPMTYDALTVNAFRTDPAGPGVKTSSGNAEVEITSVTETDVSGSISFMGPTSDGDLRIDGTFDVMRCF
jgi:hypothetical protein